MQGRQLGKVTILALIVLCLSVAVATADTLLVDDSLQGGTSGTRIGGAFQNGGFQVTGQYDAIYWHLPYPVYKGKAEFYLKGLVPGECRSWMTDKCEIYHMYDASYGDADNNYGGYRDNPYKHYIRKIGCIGGSTDAMELVWCTPEDYEEPDTAVLSWNAGNNYKFEERWYPDGAGNTILDIYRDGGLIKSITTVGSYFNPQTPSVRIGASSRRMDTYGAPLDGVYSYVKVWDQTTSVPNTPQVTAPKAGGSTNSTSPRILWAYTPASKYQVRLNIANDPNTSIIWDSGTVVSNQNWCIAGPVASPQNYYVFVRLWNATGWSSWSANGHIITVNTGYVPPNNGVVTVSGKSFYDNNAHFLGLGATYMSALRFCKYDRDRFRSDCAFLANRGINYIRILTMVPWVWKEIAPIGFTSPGGHWVDGWPDYWQQFRDCIDIAYDEFGLRTEVVVFAGAEYCMPNEANRYTHLDGIVGNINGRDHKVIFIEIANEFYQNGLTLTQLRDYGAYLNARIGRLIALSAAGGGYSMTDVYSGASCDMATEHFSRDTGTFEGGWLPVRDCWSAPGTPGVPALLTSNEPIGPGSSVSTENDPIKLVSAACFAWTAGLGGYVFHSKPGTSAELRFEDMAGLKNNNFAHLKTILPPALASWTRNDGIDPSAPFTVFCNGAPNQYWTSNPGASSGCHRNIGAWHDNDFVCYPQGILSGGLTLQARQTVTFTVYNALTGAITMGPVTKNPGDQFTLSQGPGAYIIKGTGTMVPNCPADTFSYGDGALVGQGGWYGSASASQIDVASTMARIWGGAGSYDTIKSCNCSANGSGYIPVSIKVYPGVGVNTMWSLWFDDTNGLNLGRWYGSATTARGRIGSTSDVTATQTLPSGQWSTLLVRIFPSSNTTQFFFNGQDIGTLSHASQGAGDVLGRVRFERVDNSAANGNALYFDDLTSQEESDVTPPGPVTNFVATPGDGQISLSWTNPTDADFAGTMIRYSTAGYPGSPVGGSQAYNGTGTSTVHSGLTNGLTYYYTAFAYDEVPNYSSSTTASAVPADTTPPSNVTNFTATPGDMQVSLSWTNPGGDFTGTKILFKTTGYPANASDGTSIYDSSGTSTIHSSLTNGITYYYKAFAHDEVPNYASGVQASAVPADTTPPGNVTGFTATPGDTQVVLAWTNPGGDFTGTKILFKTTGYPTGPADGTSIYDSSGTGTTHTGLTNGVTYYYKAFAHDEVPNYASGVQASAVPVGTFCFQDEFNYPEGVALVGQGGWTGTATNAHIKCTSNFVQVFGGSVAKNAVKTMNCSGGPYIWVRILAYQGVGTSTMWNVWINDAAGNNFARWYGSGTTARGRMGTSSTVTAVRNLTGGGLWDSLVVKIDPNANTTQFFFNGEDLGVYSHGTQPANTVGQLKIERENNGGAAGNHMYLDNFRISTY